MKGSCAFCRILGGDVPSHVVLDDEVALAFLDHRPVFKGHTLIVPRRHVETLADLPDDVVGPFFARAQRVARAMEVGLGSGGSFVAINNRVSQSVPHLHVHVVPRTRGDGMRGFFWPRTSYTSEDEAADYAVKLRAAITREG